MLMAAALIIEAQPTFSSLRLPGIPKYPEHPNLREAQRQTHAKPYLPKTLTQDTDRSLWGRGGGAAHTRFWLVWPELGGPQHSAPLL